MGIPVCCFNRTNIPNSDLKVSEDLTAHTKTNDKEILKNIKSINDISNAFDYILSGEYYILLSKVSSYYNLIDKIVSELNSDDVFVLIENIINWIKKTDSIENKIIKETKINIEYGTKKLINEINIIHSKKKTNILKIHEIKCLGDLSIIAQFIKYKNNNDKDKNYKNNFWKNVNEEKEIKTLSYNVSFNLMRIKDNVSNPTSNQNENKDNNTDSGKTNIEKLNTLKNESNKLYNSIEKFVNDINCKFVK